MELRRIRHIYDSRARSYDRTVGAAEHLLLGEFRRTFAADLRGDVLEVAVGSGLNLPYYPQAVTSIVGVDLSRGMLAQAHARASDLGRRVVLAQMEASRLAFPDASFDTVAISLALCTVPDPVATLREVARVCRPAGRVVLLEHVRSPLWPVAALQRLLTPLQQRALGCHLTRETVETVRDAGFAIEAEHRRVFGVVRLVVARPPARPAGAMASPFSGGADARPSPR